MQAGINGEDLSIALEPEAASVYCMRLPVDMLAGAESLKSGSAVGPFSQGVKYMVVDIGGKFSSYQIFTSSLIPYHTFVASHCVFKLNVRVSDSHHRSVSTSFLASFLLFDNF